MEASAVAPTDKQIRFIRSIASVAGFCTPDGVNADRRLASAWISVTLGALTDAELRRLPNVSRPTDAKCSADLQLLAAELSINPPLQTGASALRAWISAIGATNTHPKRDVILQYWQKALRYRNLNAFAADKTPAIAKTPLRNALPQALPELSEHFKAPRVFNEGEAIALLIAVTGESALLGIPLAYDESTHGLVPPSCALPFFNREWLEPPDPDAQKEAYFGSVLECDQFVKANPPPQSPTWPDYWRYVESFVAGVFGEKLPLIDLAQGVGRRGTAWKIVAWDSGSASKAIAEVYGKVLDGQRSDLLMRLLSEPRPPAAHGLEQALALAGGLTGHMDTFDAAKGRRQGFGLEQSQRVAATAMSSVPKGELLTVNGPPGTGKTSFLRAVIGTTCVQAALEGGKPPLMLATAATNKAVTNIIESFSEVPGPEMQAAWESRWLPGLPSYGWFYPAGSKKDEDYGSFMLLRKKWGQPGEPPTNLMAGAAAAFFADQAHKRPWMLQRFLDLHRQVLGLQSAAPDADNAAGSIRNVLEESVARMRSVQVLVRECLGAPTADPAFAETESQLEHRAVTLQAEGVAHATQSQKLTAELTQWRACLSQLREVQRLREGRTGLVYAIKKLVLGDVLGSKAQEIEDATRNTVAELDPTIAGRDEPLPSMVERRQLGVAKRLSESEEASRRTERELLAVRAQLGVWSAWRLQVATIVEQLGDAGGKFNDHVTNWAAAGFPSDASLALRAEEALDLAFRFRHFHMASRYWEARWLADAPKPGDERDGLLWLQRAAMLAPVIVATVYTVPKIHRDFEFADLLIFDESGQAAAEVGAASFAFAKRAIVVGDIYQLKPVWSVGKEADGHLRIDLGISHLPDAMSASAGSVMLTAQAATAYTSPGQVALGAGIGLVAHYRCRADIIEYCRRLVYGDGLLPQRQERPPEGQADFLYPPMAWVAVTPKESAQKDNGSWVNRDQIREIVRWLQHDGPRILAHYGKSNLSDVVALIAPFRAQAGALKTAIGQALGTAEAEAMVINTVHALQGAEKPIVAFSLTQDEVNFFVDRDGPNLMNVAVSRAKDCFILFAAPSVIMPTAGLNSGAAKRNGHPPTPLAVLVAYMNEKGKRLYPREVVVIEAPGKKVRVGEALGLSAEVISTGGHFRRINAVGTQLTAEVTNPQVVNALRAWTADLRHIDRFLLATDDDDDGEEIAWHVQQVLKEQGVDEPTRICRMRFYALAPQDIRQARELALPGIDARRVRANLVRGMFDAAMHQTFRDVGVMATRPQIALMREVDQRAKLPGQWRLTVRGRIQATPVVGHVLDAAQRVPMPMTFDSMEASQAFAVPRQGAEATVETTFTRQVKLPRYPAGTTAQTLIAAHERHGWTPARTMDALKALYLGHSQEQDITVDGIPVAQGTERAQP